MVNNEMVNNEMVNNEMVNNNAMVNNAMVNNAMVNNEMVNNEMVNNAMVNNSSMVKNMNAMVNNENAMVNNENAMVNNSSMVNNMNAMVNNENAMVNNENAMVNNSSMVNNMNAMVNNENAMVNNSSMNGRMDSTKEDAAGMSSITSSAAPDVQHLTQELVELEMTSRTSSTTTTQQQQLHPEPDWPVNPFCDASVVVRKRRYPKRKERVVDMTFGPSKMLTEFRQGPCIGQGTFAQVWHAVHRLDGMEYAIKKSKRAVRGVLDQRRALREVQAWGRLQQVPHVVQYHTCWMEEDHLYVQLEYCPETLRVAQEWSEMEVRRCLHHMSAALMGIHAQGLVHLDVKPENILLSTRQTYKLTDFGTAVKSDGSMDPPEGDTRYLALERLQGNTAHLPASDVFALGLTIYQLLSQDPLPAQGPKWHALRSGDVPLVPKYSRSLQQLISMMIHPDPLQRPRPDEILTHETMRHLPLNRL